MEGQEIRVNTKLWLDLAASEERLELMKELIKLNVGFREVEEFNLGLLSKLRSEKMKKDSEKMTRKQVRSAMEIKIRDEEYWHEEMKLERNRRRREIGERWKVNSRPYREIMRQLRDLANEEKREHKNTYEKKLKHLRDKYKGDENEKISKVPIGLEDFAHLSVFDRGRFEEIATKEEEVLCISEGVSISEDERSVLRLHTKFSVVQLLKDNTFEFEQELAYAKIRMERRKDLEEEMKRKKEDEIEAPTLEITIREMENEREKLEAAGDQGGKNLEEIEKLRDTEELRIEEEEARSRQTFDPINKIFDDRKRRVTDLKECSRVTLPKPLPVCEESLIEMRRNLHDKLYKEHLTKNTKLGEQLANLSEKEIRGLRSILRRIKLGELLVIKTDKSGKFCVVSVEDYLEMGKVHTDKDKEVKRKDVIEIEKILNGHSISWVKMFSTGLDHGHVDRVMSSKTTRSENNADLYVLYKDHKIGAKKTRPVVTGCTSNTRGLSNSVSNLLESVANSDKNNFESISGEDMLSKKEKGNREARKIKERWIERRGNKIRKKCKRCNLQEIINSCGKCARLDEKEKEKDPEGWMSSQQIVPQDSELGCSRGMASPINPVRVAQKAVRLDDDPVQEGWKICQKDGKQSNSRGLASPVKPIRETELQCLAPTERGEVVCSATNVGERMVCSDPEVRGELVCSALNVGERLVCSDPTMQGEMVCSTQTMGERLVCSAPTVGERLVCSAPTLG